MLSEPPMLYRSIQRWISLVAEGSMCVGDIDIFCARITLSDKWDTLANSE